jgi:hypothetical protein
MIMNSNRSAYRRIISGLKQLYPSGQLNGHQIRHLNTLAHMICGIVSSQSSQLEKIARKLPENNQVESRIKRLTRFNQHQEIEAEIYYLPFIDPLIQALARSGSLTLAMDGSQTGRNCMTLMVSVIYDKRAIPIAWHTVKGSKGHLSEENHIALLNKVVAFIPDNSHVVFLGDGEFDGILLQAAITEAGWEYVCRTAKNRIIVDGDDQFTLDEIFINRGEWVDMPEVGFTADGYGPVLVIAWWHKAYDEPIYLVTNMECVEEACHWYRRRFRIETFFSDQKSRGFNLQKSHLAIPERIERFLIASCLAYVWMIYLGVVVQKDQKTMRQIHRVDRCDLSLFQLGLRYLEYLLNQEQEIPFSFVFPFIKCVR